MLPPWPLARPPRASSPSSRRGRGRGAGRTWAPESLEERVVLSGFHDPSAIPYAQIAAITGQVRRGSFTSYFEGLGVDQGDQRGYTAGKSAQPGLVAARAFIHDSLAAVLGASNVTDMPFTSKGYAGVNIVGVLPGEGPDKSQAILLGAHYDSLQTPGADDAGAGVAGVLEAALALAGRRFDRTIAFVAFDQEEPRGNGWGQGSKAFAASARSAGARVAADLIIDQIGFNPHDRKGNAFNTADIGACTTNQNAPTLAIENTLAQAYTTYTSLKVDREDGINETDAYLLYQAGVPSLTTIEPLDDDGNPMSPFYETANDYYRDANGNVQTYKGYPYIDINYAIQMTAGAVAWAAIEASPIG
jgi:hypothetical protein